MRRKIEDAGRKSSFQPSISRERPAPWSIGLVSLNCDFAKERNIIPTVNVIFALQVKKTAGDKTKSFDVPEHFKIGAQSGMAHSPLPPESSGHQLKKWGLFQASQLCSVAFIRQA